jgi:hypothetical protein
MLGLKTRRRKKCSARRARRRQIKTARRRSVHGGGIALCFGRLCFGRLTALAALGRRAAALIVSIVKSGALVSGLITNHFPFAAVSHGLGSSGSGVPSPIKAYAAAAGKSCHRLGWEHIRATVHRGVDKSTERRRTSDGFYVAFDRSN